MSQVIHMGEEKIHERLEEAKPLLARHWEEVAIRKNIRPLDPDWAWYEQMSRSGRMRAFVVRYDAPPAVRMRPVGYAVFVISPHPHYKTWNAAKSDLYWVDPDFRHQGLGSRMFLACEDWLRNTCRVHTLIHEVRPHLNPKGDLMEKLGYDLVGLCFEKVLQVPTLEP